MSAEPHPIAASARWLRVRRRALIAGLAILAVLALYLAFEAGRFVAGYNVISAARERGALEADIASLRSQNRTMQARVVELQTINVGHRHEDQVVTRTISNLQAQIARQAEKLAFYRGVVAQGAPPIGLRVGEVLLSAGKLPLHYVVNISLLRANRPDGVLNGTVSLSVDGHGPRGTSLDNQTLTGSSTATAYHFRYYQELEQAVVLPPGFAPAHLTVTVRSHRKDVAPLIQTYRWSAISEP